MSTEPERMVSLPQQYENVPELESIFVKEELLSDLDLTDDEGTFGGRSKKLEKTPFCALCLRECTSDVRVRFSSQPKPDHIDATEGQRKLEQVLRLKVALDDGVVCRTCWKLVDIVGDFRECCLKSASRMERFSRGMQYEVELDSWLSRDLFNSMEVVHKAIQDNGNRMEMENVIYITPEIAGLARKGRKKPVVNLKPEVQMKGLSDGLCVADKVRAARKNRKKPVVKTKPEVQMEGFSDDVDVSDKVRVAKKSRKKPVKKVKPEAQIEDFSCGVDVLGKERSKSANPAVALLGNDNHTPTILPCEKCGRQFDGIAAHRMHVQRCATTKTTKYYTCSICNATFMEQCALGFHMNKHNGIRPLKCRKFCDRTFSSHFVRMKHERYICEVDGRICSTCGAKLKNEFSLKKHIERVHGEAKHVCATCGRAFRTSVSLGTHQRVHSDERKYPCKVCEKAYKSPYAVKVHMRIHTQENPFPCHLCDQVFNYKVSMKSHIERYHGQMG